MSAEWIDGVLQVGNMNRVDLIKFSAGVFRVQAVQDFPRLPECECLAGVVVEVRHPCVTIQA